MMLRNKEYPRPKIRKELWIYRKECGQVEWCAGLFYLLFLGLILCSQLQVEVYRTSAQYLEDALAASNLASAVIDLEEYGKTHTLLIKDPLESYGRFCAAIKGNLQLNDWWECENKQLITGQVRVVKYIVYNVKEHLIKVSEVSPNGAVYQWEGTLGTVTAPNGVCVEASGIYSEITYPVTGWGGAVVEARKGKLVDVVADVEE